MNMKAAIFLNNKSAGKINRAKYTAPDTFKLDDDADSKHSIAKPPKS